MLFATKSLCVRFWEPTNGAGIRGFRTTRWLRFKIFDLILRLTPETSFAAQEIYFGGACGMPRAARELSAFERSEQGWPNSIQEMP